MTRLTGVVEGFYGRRWDWGLRRLYAQYLHDCGLNSYLYCPKGDTFLRRQWSQAWPREQQQELQQQAALYRERGLHWGVGLSPYALYLEYGPVQRRQLQAKVAQIDDLGGSILAVLFDDMPGDIDQLAQRQGEIVADIARWSHCERLLVCPTYYSFDPILEQFFGACPANYWHDFGHLMPDAADILWTGNQVCSDTVSVQDINAITTQLGRAPVLWDNYPVNDGRKASRFLHIRPLSGREQDLSQLLAGHLANPMNQGYLSMIPLLGLAALYGRVFAGQDLLEFGLQRYCSGGLAKQLGGDIERFQDAGLDTLDAAARQQLTARYQAFDEPIAAEIGRWLGEGYAFDPQCLND